MTNHYRQFDTDCASRMAAWQDTRRATTLLWIGFLVLCAGVLLVAVAMIL